MPTPHKHAALIKQWADDPNLIFEYQLPRGTQWYPVVSVPQWAPDRQYRVKPREFPKSSLSSGQLDTLYRDSSFSHVAVAAAVIKQFILDQEAAATALDDILPREIES